MDRIDFRSDTVSWPTPAMRAAMAQAPVGDDVLGEDPTINELEAQAAARVGTEAALFVASGTMGNLTGILSHATRGEEAIVGVDSHTFRYEAGGMASLGGIVPHTLPTDEQGRLDLAQVEMAVRPDDPHHPRTRLLLVENSYGIRSGYPIGLDYFADIRDIADRHGLVVHLDGARLFNAAAALDIPAAEIVRHVDSVSFCLSKGLCAPVGSLLCGSADFIYRARRVRKSLGGGMRQAGILAAAGLIALNEMTERLVEDHAHARLLAEGLAEIPGVIVDPAVIKTNILFIRLSDDFPMTVAELADYCRTEANIWIKGANRQFRAVTHYWIGRSDVELFIDVVRAASTGQVRLNRSGSDGRK